MTSPEEPAPIDREAGRLPQPGEHVLCYACRKTGRCQLGIRSVASRPDRALVAQVTCPAGWEGGPKVAHGGWTAATFDEVLGHLGLYHATLTVTGTLTVEFVKPVPIERELEVHGRVDRVEGRRWYISGEMSLKATGAVLGRAKGIFVQRNPTHFDAHQRWMEEQDRLAGA